MSLIFIIYSINGIFLEMEDDVNMINHMKYIIFLLNYKMNLNINYEYKSQIIKW